MRFWLPLLAAVLMVFAQVAFPGASLYHTGWYNVLDLLLFVLAVAQRSRNLIAAFGAAVIVLAGVSAGLMGAQTQSIAGTPGATVYGPDAGGSLHFPLRGTRVAFARGSSNVVIADARRYSGAYVFWQTPREVVSVVAQDRRGNPLTVTQPSNDSFLSPVLLMQQQTTIAGMNVHFDTFSVPAMQRDVRAVLFSSAQAAQLHTAAPLRGPAVLFDVAPSNRAGSEGIGIVPSGGSAEIGGLILGARVLRYPAITIASAPYLPALAIGILVLIGSALTLRTPSRSRT